MQGQGSRASPKTPLWRRFARACVLGLICGLAHADAPRAVEGSHPPPTLVAARAEVPRKPPAPVAHSGLQRWGLRLMALGVGAWVGWALLRLGRNVSTTYPPAYRSGSPRRAR